MRTRVLLVGLAAVAAALTAGLGIAGAHGSTVGVTPSSFAAVAQPGDTFTVEKTVHTPEIAPKPDVYFLADTTGSMGAAIANVAANAGAILASVDGASADARYGAGDYKDFPFDPYVFQNAAAIPAADDNGAAALAAIAGWSASGGADGPEGQLFALKQIAAPSSGAYDVGWRAGSTRILVWFGDWPGHDPVCTALTGLSADITQASAIADLVAAGVRVIAVSTTTGLAGGLDADPLPFSFDYTGACGAPGGSAGQASAIAAATGGLHLVDVAPGDVSSAIIAGLQNLPITVTPSASCSSGLSVSFVPAGSTTVTSGDDVTYTETIAVSGSATPGTYSCTVDFLLDGKHAAGFTQTVRIEVRDVKPPVAGCSETNNPSGGKVPPAGPAAGKSGQNPDGFYVLRARDDFDPAPKLYVGDTASAAVFGPFASGTKIKLTQAPGVTPSQKPGSGDIDWKIQLKGDAAVWAVDAAGNTSPKATCLVPRPPK